MTPPRADAGFTLVEALVSLFVFSLIAAGSVLMLTQSVTSQRQVGEAQAALREVQAARALLSADMMQIAERPTRGPDGRARPHFIGGDADSPLMLVRAAAEPDRGLGARTALVLVEYHFRDGAITRSSRAGLDQAGGGADAGERVIVADAGDPHFEFYDGVEWRREWLSATRGAPPPRAVALVFNSRRYGPMRIEATSGLVE